MNPGLAHLGSALLRWRRAILLGGPALVGAAVLASGQGAAFDQLLRSGRDGIRSHPASGEIHIVEMDARSLAAIGRWPWPRGVHAEIVDKLHEAGARSIVFDVDVSAASSPAEDEKLAAALKRAGGSVVLPTFRQDAGSGSSEYIDTKPLKLFEQNAFLGAVNVLTDPDGQIREMLLGIETEGVPRPSLATMLAEEGAEIGRSFPIDYSIEPSTIPRHSVINLISGNIPAQSLAGKRFVIGATAIELGDRYGVPRYGVIPGVVIQALAAETLLQGPTPTRLAGGWMLSLALALLALALWLKSRAARVFAVSGALLATLLLPLATESLFAVTMPIAAACAALGTAMALGAGAYGMRRFLENAMTDDATGLPNVAALAFQGGRNRCDRVVVARIDRFSTIASGLGPAATATLVQRVAERLAFLTGGQRIFRVDDAVLAWTERRHDPEGIDTRLDGLIAGMRAPVECGRPVDVSLTFGVADGALVDVKQTVANAGLAAAQAAQRGERCKRFVAADSAEIDWTLALLGELDGAMAAGQLWNAYQPKLDLASGQIIGAEALVRWAHPVRGPISPDSFIPVIEEAGRIRDLTVHVLSQGLDDAAQWDEMGFPIGVAVNVSATLLADHEFIETIGRILQSHRLPNHRVTIEVTESAAMASPERAIAALASWRSLGVRISIDDYGTGQSSLGYLQKLPATELKIDKSFVQTLVTDQRNEIMVRSTIALAHELGMKIVAEGIEDAVCLQRLAELGCDTGQGYHIAAPLAADELGAFLAERVLKAA
jgi:EAL domain-containing protein (putative c-di-GMP-specific phosphodiesterase class I)/CHASE2 domain-containing sensor protein